MALAFVVPYNNRMTTITYFVHSITTDNENKRATGWQPGELSAVGIEKAEALREQLADRQFDVVFCSDLQRAVDSAQIFFGDRFAIVQDKRLREANYGEYTGGPFFFKEHVQDFINVPFPGGESYHDVERRMRDFCDFLAANYDGKHVAIVAHHAPQMALDVILKHKTWEQAFAQDWRKTGGWQPGWDYIIAS